MSRAGSHIRRASVVIGGEELPNQEAPSRATAASFPHDSRQPAEPVQIGPYLARVDQPNGLRLKLLYRLLRQRFGKVPGWLTVFSARMPLAFTNWIGKVSKLDEKLELSSDTQSPSANASR